MEKSTPDANGELYSAVSDAEDKTLAAMMRSLYQFPVTS
jgi:hypothetical protein